MMGALFCGGLLRADDDYVHSFTGFTFPQKVGAFERGRITPFNEAHSDIEVDYDNKPYTVHLSAYVYPAHDLLKKHYEQCKADVMQVHPDAKLLEENPMTLDKAGTKYDGFYALFLFRGKFVANTDQDLLSQLIVFQRGDYYVLFRISYAASDKVKAEAEINDFIQQLAWPKGDGSASSST